MPVVAGSPRSPYENDTAQHVASGGSAMLIPENTAQQALNAGVREYKAAFAKALKTMPALLRTTSDTPNLPGPPRAGHHGGAGRTAKPSPSHR